MAATSKASSALEIGGAGEPLLVGDGQCSETNGMTDPNDVGVLRNVSAVTMEATAYVWDIASDSLSWEPNVANVLGIRNVQRVATGQAYSLLVVPEHVNRRKAFFTPGHGEDLGSGVPYHMQYRLTPSFSRNASTLWIEEQGRWWAGDDGEPSRARGTIRVMSEEYREQTQHLLGNDHDELTGQLNRIRLTAALDAVISRADVTGRNGAFLVASINNLSIINETFGFDVGDDVIAAVAQTLRSQLRGGDAIGRYSSNKFGIILNDCGPGAMRVAAERLIKAVGDARIENTVCPLAATLSIGGVLLPTHAGNVNQALTRALEALDAAKGRRQDCFVAYEADPAKESARRRNIAVAEDVSKALDDERIHLLLQPIVRSDTREPDFYECLMRMVQPDGQIISAGEFVEVAEQLGLARLIDQRTLELALALLHAEPELRLSLNVSGLTCGDHDWLLYLHKLVSGKRDLASRLTIEITETTAIHDLDQSIVFVDTLKELGCRVAIDDFGAGYTSFKNLKHLAVDMVKIDGAFVRNLVRDESDRVFLATMVQLAQNFGMETVAEWVVDEPTAQIVADIGITHMQGFHIGKPLPPCQVSDKLNQF